MIIATGGAGRVFRENTNGGIVTGDGMALAYRHGAPLRDMEFIQYHPTCMPGTGLLFTEACRGEGGFLLNRHGERYLQDYGLGPAQPTPRNKAMELGPRDRLSQAFWHEKRKGNTISSRHGEVVHLDLRHLGERRLRERLPQIRALAIEYLGVDPAREPIPVLPAVHYTMGGILADANTAAPLAGLFSAGECSSIGIHGANRLGSNSLTELLVFGKVAGIQAAACARSTAPGNPAVREALAAQVQARALSILSRDGGNERIADLRREMAQSMEDGCGIYRTATTMRATCERIAQLRQRVRHLRLDDHSRGWNTEWLLALELGFQLEVAQAMAHSALERQRIPRLAPAPGRLRAARRRQFPVHSLAHYAGDGAAADRPMARWPSHVAAGHPGLWRCRLNGPKPRMPRWRPVMAEDARTIAIDVPALPPRAGGCAACGSATPCRSQATCRCCRPCNHKG